MPFVRTPTPIIYCHPITILNTPNTPSNATSTSYQNASTSRIAGTRSICWISFNSIVGTIVANLTTYHQLFPVHSLLVDVTTINTTICNIFHPSTTTATSTLPAFHHAINNFAPHTTTRYLQPSTTTLAQPQDRQDHTLAINPCQQSIFVPQTSPTLPPPLPSTDTPIPIAPITTFLHQHPTIHGIDAHCPSHNLSTQCRWIRSLTAIIASLHSSHDLTCFLLSLPTHPTHPSDDPIILSLITSHLPHPWLITHSISLASKYHDPIAACRILLLGEYTTTTPYSTAILPTPDPNPTSLPRLGDAIITELNYTMPTNQTIPYSNTQPSITPYMAQHLPIALSCNTPPTPTHWSSGAIFHPDFVCPELWTLNHSSQHLPHPLFHIPFASANGIMRLRLITPLETLLCYGLPEQQCLTVHDNPSLTTDLTSITQCILPHSLAAAITDSIIQHSIFSLLDTRDAVTSQVVHCCTAQARPIPSAATWAAAYAHDSDTNCILTKLRANIHHQWTRLDLASVNSSYRPFLRDHRATIHLHRLVFLHPLDNGQSLMLIVIPASLRLDVFSAYHASPSAGHLGEYKTLYRLRTRFFWPKIRKDVTDWVRTCAHCVATHGHLRPNSELVYTWPVVSPFSLIHVDL